MSSSDKKTAEREASDVPIEDDIPLTERKLTEGYGSTYDPNLFLFLEKEPKRARVANLLKTINRYSVSIPSVKSDTSIKLEKAKLGTIAGVYLPCIQSILGVMFFLRFTWIIGTAGIIFTLLIVLLSCCATFLTTISLSAIATNGLVPAGGSYFMISRALGPEFGGAVGVLFYLANTMAGSLYITGAIEIFMHYLAPGISLFGDIHKYPSAVNNNSRVFSTILLAITAFIVYIGVRFVSKLAPVALVVVLLAILSVFIGVFVHFDGDHDLKVCMLGDRLLYHGSRGDPMHSIYHCSKDPDDPKSLYHLYCQKKENEETSCYPYFENHNTSEPEAIPGLRSGVFLKNLKNHFCTKMHILSHCKNSPLMYTDEKLYNQIRVHTSTSFIHLIGLFFPSVTGIMAGSNRSGDLADASKSIPTGTIAAHLTTTIIYVIGVLLFGGSFDQLFLRDKYSASCGCGLAVAAIAWPSTKFVIIGAFVSCCGAALQCLIGAPRLLQAIAKDRIIPFLNIFSRTTPQNEPVRALLLTIFICELGILIGNLDLIAPIQTMFFLMCYMFVNLACVLQSLLRTPNWRPRFRFYHWTFASLGSFLSFVFMFLISWYYAIVAVLIALFLYKYIEYRGAEKEWGDGFRGLALSAARYSLFRVEDGPVHTKNWRPQILIFCKLDRSLEPKYPNLFDFASQLKAGKGFTLICAVIEGEFEQMLNEVETAKLNIKSIMTDRKVKGFITVLVTESRVVGISNLIQTAGLGGMKHNTVVLGWPYGWKESSNALSKKSFLNTLRIVMASKCALLIPKGINCFPGNCEKLSGIIDIWWIVNDGGLLMLIPFLLMKHKTWKRCKLRIFTVAQVQDNIQEMKADLEKFLYQLRIEAEVQVVEMLDTDISAYTYERTILMERRYEILTRLNLSVSRKSGDFQFNEVQNIVDHYHRKSSASSGSSGKSRTSGDLAEAVAQGKRRSSDFFAEKKAKESRNKQKKDIPRLEATRSYQRRPSSGTGAIMTSIDESKTLKTDDEAQTSRAAATKASAEDNLKRSSSSSSDQSKSSEDGEKNVELSTSTESAQSHTKKPELAASSISGLFKTPIHPEEINVRRMHTAVKLNEMIRTQSRLAELVILNLPTIPKTDSRKSNYMEFLEVLTEGLDRVLMVRGSGREVITIYS